MNARERSERRRPFGGFGGESLEEDESQEGNGLLRSPKHAAQRHGLPVGKALKTAYPFSRED